MADDKPKDETGEALRYLFIVFLVAFLAWLVTGGPEKAKDDTLFGNGSSSSSTVSSKKDSEENKQNQVPLEKITQKTESENLDPSISPYRGKIKIRLENSRSIYQPNQEYISLYAPTSNKENIEISGWKLKNGKEEKVYERSGRLVRYSSDVVAIPQGLNIFYSGGPYNLSAVKLEPGGRVYVVTGQMPNTIPFPIPYSFRLNKCSGYLENIPNYNFSPTLPANCPRAYDEADDFLPEDSCLNFLKNVRVCRIPEIKEDGTVDGKFGVGEACKSFIRERLNYNGCLKAHIGDLDFFSADWLVYLKYSGELWPRNGSITLYDQNGKIVERLEY